MPKKDETKIEMTADQFFSKLEDLNKPSDILIVDDVYANVFLVENILSGEFTTDTANGAEEMWRYIRVKQPRLILLDLMMPFEDGFSVLKKISADERLKKIPVIVLSAKDTKDDVVKAMKLGAVDYVVKPVDEKSLLKKVRKALGIVQDNPEAEL